MTNYERAVIKYEVIKTITFASGSTLNEKLYNALASAESYMNRLKEKEEEENKK